MIFNFLKALIIGFIVYKQRNAKKNEEKPSIICPNDDTREIVVNYKEEAGEENTVNFHNIFANPFNKIILNLKKFILFLIK
jgi:hypothetical protein